MENENEIKKEEVKKIHIELSPYDYHELLKIIEFNLKFANVDNALVENIYEVICTQVDGREVYINGSKKSRAAFPEQYKLPEPKPEQPQKQIENTLGLIESVRRIFHK